jgi:tellurite resistance protein TerC
MTPALEWSIFGAVIVTLLSLDLFVFNRNAHEVKFKEAVLVACFWVGLALVFNIGIYFVLGPRKALEFLTGYLIEESLSVDNLFVFIMIFSYFRIDRKYQHSILFWGIVGAIIMRAVFIFAGVALIQRFHWIIYVFGGFLVFTGLKMAFQSDEEIHPEKNPVIRLARRVLPITHDAPPGRFAARINGKLMFTPMFIVLIVVETTDLVFALDSIPAVLAISTDPFIVYSSNIFAILGLRALYFALSGAMAAFHYLKYGLSAILIFVGAKMLVSHFYKMPIVVALGVVGGVLALSVVASIVLPGKEPPQPPNVEV